MWEMSDKESEPLRSRVEDVKDSLTMKTDQTKAQTGSRAFG